MLGEDVRVATPDFPPFRLNWAHGRLYRDSEYVPVRLKTLAVLHYLIEHRERVVSRNELIQAIWPDRFGADVAPRQCILELRKLLGDSTRHPRFIETVGRHGYRFIGALEMESRELRHWRASVVVFPRSPLKRSTIPYLAAASLRPANPSKIARLTRIWTHFKPWKQPMKTPLPAFFPYIRVC